MADGRKNNGGNSTKSKGIDRRKNQYKNVLEDTLTKEQLSDIILMLYNKSLDKQDTKAAQLLLEHYLGKPNQTLQQSTKLSLGEDFDITKIYDPKA